MADLMCFAVQGCTLPAAAAGPSSRRVQLLQSLPGLPAAGSHPAPARLKPHSVQQRGASASQPSLEQTGGEVRSEAGKQLWWGLYL